MTLKISLDRAALEALFPEGTEARANLQRAVITDLIGKLAIKDCKLLDAELQRQVHECTARLNRELLAKHFGSNHMFLNEQVEEAVKKAVQAEYRSLVTDTVLALRADLLITIRDRASEFKLDEEGLRVVVGRLVREELKNMVGGK